RKRPALPSVGAERSVGDAFRESLPYPAVEPIAPRDDRFEMRGRGRFELQNQRRAMQLVENGVNGRIDKRAELLCRAEPAVFDLVEKLQQPIERVLVAGEQNLFFVLEVVVEIAFLHVQRGGDVFDCGAVVAEPAEGLRGALEDVDARRGCRDGAARPARAPGATLRSLRQSDRLARFACRHPSYYRSLNRRSSSRRVQKR